MEYSNDEIKKLIIAGFINGYEAGHDDTVESRYPDAQDRGKDWMEEAIHDGGLEYTLSLIDLD